MELAAIAAGINAVRDKNRDWLKYLIESLRFDLAIVNKLKTKLIKNIDTNTYRR